MRGFLFLSFRRGSEAGGSGSAVGFRCRVQISKMIMRHAVPANELPSLSCFALRQRQNRVHESSIIIIFLRDRAAF